MFKLLLAFPTEPWRRNQYAVFVAVFVSWLGFSFVQPFLPLYIQELGVRDVGQVAFLSGIALGVSPLLSGLLAPAWGIMADRYGVKIMVQRALLSFAVFNTLASLVVSPWQLLALRAGIGFFGGFGPMTAALVTIGAPPKEVGPAIGRLQAIQIFAGAVGPTLGGLVADRFGIRTSFVVTAALCAASFLLMTALYREERGAVTLPLAGDHLPVRALLVLPGFIALAAVLFISQFVERGFGPIIPLFIANLDPLAPIASTAGIVFSIGLFVSAIAASQIGRLINAHGVRRLLPICLAVGVVATVPLFVVSQIWQLAALRVILGISTGTIVTIAYSAAARMVPERSRSTAFGFLGSATSLSNALGPVGAGAITTISLRAMFLVDAVLYVAATAVGFVVSRTLSQPVESGTGG
jgi:DHA1 family multidrug resistance protein-like MFS transporter